MPAHSPVEPPRRPNYSLQSVTAYRGGIFPTKGTHRKKSYRKIANTWLRTEKLGTHQFVSSKMSPKALNAPACINTFHSSPSSHRFLKEASADCAWLKLPKKGALTWPRLEKRVLDFTRLKKGWDSYDAEPPSPMAARNTLAFLDLLKTLSLQPDWVEPTSDDSIMLEVKVGGFLQEWDFYSDGDVAVLYELENGRNECHLVKPEVWELASYLTTPPHVAK